MKTLLLLLSILEVSFVDFFRVQQSLEAYSIYRDPQSQSCVFLKRAFMAHDIPVGVDELYMRV